MNKLYPDEKTQPFSVTITEGFSIRVPVGEIAELRRKEKDGVLEMNDISSFHPERCYHEAILWDEFPCEERSPPTEKQSNEKTLSSPVNEVCIECAREYEVDHKISSCPFCQTTNPACHACAAWITEEYTDCLTCADGCNFKEGDH